MFWKEKNRYFRKSLYWKNVSLLMKGSIFRHVLEHVII